MNAPLGTTSLVVLALAGTLAVALPAQADEYATAAELGLMEGFPPAADKQVDRSNALMTPPFNRWAYLRMRTIYPSSPIRSSSMC